MAGMTRRALGFGVLLAPAAARAQAPAAAAWKLPSDAEIAALLAARLDQQRQGVGIVVGVIDASGRRIVSHGVRAKGDARPLDGDTVFEIGSMTKVFTSLILADMVRKGEVKLDDPLQKYLPADVRVPERGGKQITLVDLATHTSALPSLPDNFKPKDAENPYADYTLDQLWTYLNGYTLTRDIGVQYAYSNMAVGLLGLALTWRAGAPDYETLVRTRVLRPLGMKDTAITLTPPMKARLAPGHTASLEPAANWDLPVFAGAGALRSSANDMLTFLAAELGFRDTPLKAAMVDEYTLVRRKAGGPMDVALGWHIAKFATGEIIWHNGGTGGYRTYFGFDPRLKIGAVVLTNAATPAGGDDIGMHLLAGRPLQVIDPPPPPRVAISLPPEQLSGLVGRYQFAGTPAVMTVTQDGGRLFAQLTGQSAYEIFPESPVAFFFKVVDAQLTFERGPDGRAAKVVLHQLGRDKTALRVAP
jgi:D-alanyl-D-alanine-carboxypeptidase/D-alanyl-D-alanine-endopeptidase